MTRGWLDTYRTCAKRNRSRKRDIALQYVTSSMFDSSDPILELSYDAERGILYALSRASTLHMYDLGTDGDGFRYVCSLEVKGLVSKLRNDGRIAGDTETQRRLEADIAAAEKAQMGTEKSEGGGGCGTELHCAIVALAPISASLSAQMQLVVTSSSGVRVFLSTVATTAPNRPPRPERLLPLFALPPPLASDGKTLRCMRDSTLSAGTVTTLASGIVNADGGVEFLCLTDLPLPTVDQPAPTLAGSVPVYSPSTTPSPASSDRSILTRVWVQGVTCAFSPTQDAQTVCCLTPAFALTQVVLAIAEEESGPDETSGACASANMSANMGASVHRLLLLLPPPPQLVTH